MKALMYHDPGERAPEGKPKPTAEEPTDAVVRITHTTICGTDLHIMKGGDAGSNVSNFRTRCRSSPPGVFVRRGKRLEGMRIFGVIASTTPYCVNNRLIGT